MLLPVSFILVILIDKPEVFRLNSLECNCSSPLLDARCWEAEAGRRSKIVLSASSESLILFTACYAEPSIRQGSSAAGWLAWRREFEGPRRTSERRTAEQIRRERDA